MKISNLFIALIVLCSVSCSSKSTNNEHGHDHETSEHGHTHEEGTADHEHDDHHEQEEFTIEGDSSKVDTDSTHTHEDGSTHHSH
ncbi:hypothetical protein QQ008_25995 [Fulvivirgaceae bacterium BMA10]|uniref:Uncharacterized protein n=1 Tax=Splendidivirga corallicola TaxID=3051826 RepID=A0ABT8KZP3_9BACT|nr:hypothetical protein [Fulvivirgaceae bacterium BMA10]